jgi:nucleoside-diphosphate-sugar epimerase
MIKNQSISVIGGSGFIGTRLVRRLLASKRFTVQIIDKSTSKAFPDLVKFCDVRSSDGLKKSIANGSIIVNLAAEHRDDVRPVNLYEEVNVEGAKNICAAAIDNDVNTIIFTSSVAVYGFAPVGTDENGLISPFNEYGRTKHEAERVFQAWQSGGPDVRKLVIIRPTVVFGEQNRGNVYNLLRQISSGMFVMIGDGKNRKSIAYVENIAAFIEYCLDFKPGVYIYNFIDKPDFTMNSLVSQVKVVMGRSQKISFRIPFAVGFFIGKFFDFISIVSGRSFAISSIRVKKFCSDSVYNTSIDDTGFVSPVPVEIALEKTVRYEFLESHEIEGVFYSE